MSSADARLLRQLRLMTLPVRERAFALMQAFHVQPDDKAANDKAWLAVQKLVQEPVPNFAMVVEMIRTAQRSGLAIDQCSLMRACGCANRAILKNVWPTIAAALAEPIARVVPTGTTVVPAPVTAWPARGGES
jgi:hypothetical protein